MEDWVGPLPRVDPPFVVLRRAPEGSEPLRLRFWISEKREPSSARWEWGNRALGDFQGAVGNVGNRSLVFHVFHGPGISTALGNVSA